jgi:hypothetical protein
MYSERRGGYFRYEAVIISEEESNGDRNKTFNCSKIKDLVRKFSLKA